MNDLAQLSTRQRRGTSQSLQLDMILHNVSVNVLFYNLFIFPEQGLGYQIQFGGQYDFYIFILVLKALYLKPRKRQLWFNMLLFKNVLL